MVSPFQAKTEFNDRGARMLAIIGRRGMAAGTRCGKSQQDQ